MSTPETDAFAIKFKTTCGEKYWVPVDIARKLECERNEASDKIKSQTDRIRYLEGANNNYSVNPLSVALRERDEARGALERISHASMNARHKEEDYAEWEKAVFVLLDICEERKVK